MFYHLGWFFTRISPSSTTISVRLIHRDPTTIQQPAQAYDITITEMQGVPPAINPHHTTHQACALSLLLQGFEKMVFRKGQKGRQKMENKWMLTGIYL